MSVASGANGNSRDGPEHPEQPEIREAMAAAPARARARVSIAASADGFIACEDGAIDRLERAHAGAAPGEDFGDRDFFDSVDALVIGHRNFELVRGFEPWPFGDRPLSGPLPHDVAPELVDSRVYTGGCVQNRWRVAPGGYARTA